MPMPRTRSGTSSRTDSRRCGMVRSGPFGASSPAQVYRASVKPENRGHSPIWTVQSENVPYFPALPAFPCTSGTEAPFVQAHRKGRCRLGPTPVLRRPTWAGKEAPNGPNRSAGTSPIVAALAVVGARHRDVALADGAAGSLVGRDVLGRVRPGPFPPVHVGRRSANAGSRRCHAIRWAVTNGASIPFAQGERRKALRKVPLVSWHFRSAVDLDRRKGTRPDPTKPNPTQPDPTKPNPT